MKKQIFSFLFLLLANPAIHTFEWKNKNQTVIGQLPPKLAAKLPADVTYLIADLKYSPGNLKIIEFGTGTEAGYKVLNHIYGKKGVVWSYFWNFLYQFKIPIWHISSRKKDSYTSNHYAWDTFRKHRGRYTYSLRTLIKDPLFKRRDKIPSMPNKISAHTGVAIIRRRRKLHRNVLKHFRKKHPGMMFVNEASYDYVNHKNLTDALFQTPELSKFRPKAGIYPKQYHANLHTRIKEEIGSEWFVIKPVFSGRGNGILMVHKDKLDKILKLILVKYKNNKPTDNLFNFRPSKPLVLDYWKHDRNANFIVEEYAYSKHIQVNGKEYEPTMRAIFTLHHDHGQIFFNFIDCYWKRPMKSVNEEGSFREKHISKHGPNKAESLGLVVNQEDRKGVIELLSKLLPEVYTSMLVDYHLENKIRINRQQVRLGLI